MHYDELLIICGDDDACGDFSKDYDDSPHVASDGFSMADEDLSFSEAQPQPPRADAPDNEIAQSSGGRERVGRGRLSVPAEVLQGLVDRVGDVATSIASLKEEAVDRKALFQALFELKDELMISPSQLLKVYDCLVRDNKIALGFMDMPVEFRKIWLVDFVLEAFRGQPPA
jgi:hypothetical protein